MREMTDGHSTLKITRHIMLRNFWEYYIYGDVTKDGYANALVMGFETEAGSVYLPELEPYIISSTSNLDGVMPAEGWKWVN